MTNSHGTKPRFGTDFLFNWLSMPADDPAVVLERQLALTVMQRGRPTNEVSAFGYSRQDWELEHHGHSAKLTFQNFAQREGSNPRQFAAYTLTVISPSAGDDKPEVTLLRSAHEQAYKYGTHTPCGSEDFVQLANSNILIQLEAELPKPLVVHKQAAPVAA